MELYLFWDFNQLYFDFINIKSGLIMEEKQYPKGHFISKWIGIGMAIFSGIGISIAFATDNMGLLGIGPAIGVGFGAGIGSMLEKKYSEKGLIRQLNENEIKQEKKGKIVALSIGILGVLLLTFIILFVLNN